MTVEDFLGALMQPGNCSWLILADFLEENGRSEEAEKLREMVRVQDHYLNDVPRMAAEINAIQIELMHYRTELHESREENMIPQFPLNWVIGKAMTCTTAVAVQPRIHRW